MENVDLDLFADWPEQPGGRRETRLSPHAGRLLLEVKSREAGQDDLRMLLGDMTREMRAQFDYFRTLRESAEKALADPADEAAAKASRADAKAASDAMSLIVRTLEKIDSLQRQFAHDRQMEAERQADALDPAAARAHFLALIDARAEEEASIRFERFKHDWLNAHTPTTAAEPQPPPPRRGDDGQGDGDLLRT
ncbi:MAG: hypothetical protein J0I23_04335 [Rhizobiales bacterium]|nr:hypothetical protein [Hyphomicrobiales bacterium]